MVIKGLYAYLGVYVRIRLYSPVYTVSKSPYECNYHPEKENDNEKRKYPEKLTANPISSHYKRITGDHVHRGLPQ
ncbi:MAG: hypothetical protein GOVbin1807_194 [Prokaryotic dsDNA virus sp.]|nr:MAG: hypothetical protein GOVbin1807_194 [Prokaryotic dsDNA virus sp.]